MAAPLRWVHSLPFHPTQYERSRLELEGNSLNKLQPREVCEGCNLLCWSLAKADARAMHAQLPQPRQAADRRLQRVNAVFQLLDGQLVAQVVLRCVLAPLPAMGGRNQGCDAVRV